MQGYKLWWHFIPAIILVASWAVVLLIRQIPIVTFDNISTGSVIYLLFFFICFLLGNMLGPFISQNTKVSVRPLYSYESVNNKVNGLLILSVLAISLLLYKTMSYMGTAFFSLSDITEMRLLRGRDPDDIKGGTIIGMLAMILSGFPIMMYMYKEYFFYDLTITKRKQVDIIFVLSIFTSFLSGGRWVAAISIVVVFILFKLRKYNNHPINIMKRTNFSRYKIFREKRSYFSKFIKIILSIAIIYISSMFFIDRASGNSDEQLVNILNQNFEGMSLSLGMEEFLWNNPWIIRAYYTASLYQYYITHGLYQFDVLLSAPYPSNAPYYLTYQLYLHVMVLNKLGGDFLSISTILNEIINPGVYFTVAGAFFLGFGYWGGGVCIFIVSLMGSYFWSKLLINGRFFDNYISILYLIFIIFSPIVAITSTGVYSSLLTLIFVVKFFIPKAMERVNE